MHPGHQLRPPQFQENETVTWVADGNVKVLPLTPFTVISELYVAGADAKQVARVITVGPLEGDTEGAEGMEVGTREGDTEGAEGMEVGS